jgi:solute:Na+ symporter, SSS family
MTGEGVAENWWAFIAAFLTFALGSVPQQDVFQRVTSAKDEKTAIMGTLGGGGFYFLFAFVPMFIAYSAVVIDPAYTALFSSEDPRAVQRILPELILNRMPIYVQILFFGALLSAILSTASGTLLAPSSLFTENVILPVFKMTDKTMLIMLRTVLIVFSIAATCIALNTKNTMYEMVQNAYKVTLVAAFVPLAMGVFWNKACTQGAVLSIAFGIGAWLFCEWNQPAEGVAKDWFQIIPPQLVGLAASFVGMVIGSISPEIIPHAEFDEEALKNKPRVSTGH